MIRVDIDSLNMQMILSSDAETKLPKWGLEALLPTDSFHNMKSHSEGRMIAFVVLKLQVNRSLPKFAV